MESYGEGGKIHLSSATANLVFSSPGMHLVHRGKMEIKGKGDMDTYWLS